MLKSEEGIEIQGIKAQAREMRILNETCAYYESHFKSGRNWVNKVISEPSLGKNGYARHPEFEHDTF